MNSRRFMSDMGLRPAEEWTISNRRTHIARPDRRNTHVRSVGIQVRGRTRLSAASASASMRERRSAIGSTLRTNAAEVPA